MEKLRKKNDRGRRMIIVYLLLVIWFLSILFWLVDAIRKLDDEIPPKANSETMMLGDMHIGSKKYNKKELDRFMKKFTNHDSFVRPKKLNLIERIVLRLNKNEKLT
jgi:hypothetical protein